MQPGPIKTVWTSVECAGDRVARTTNGKRESHVTREFPVTQTKPYCVSLEEILYAANYRGGTSATCE